MIIAVATESNKVASHFGRCSEYTLFKVGDGKICDQKVIANPGHEPGFLPGYLADLGVGCIIAGGMGSRAQSLFNAENIETHVGVEGPVRDVVEAFLAGSLEQSASSCEHLTDGHGCR